MDKPKTSLLAVAPLVLGVLGFCTFGLSALIGLALGILALRRIGKTGPLKNRNIALAGIVVSAIPLALLLVILTAALCLRESTSQRTERILREDRLAALPPSATEIQASGWGGLFTGEDYLMFRATAEDIDKFVASSPSIKDVHPEIFTSEHMHLPYTKKKTSPPNEGPEAYFKHKHFFPGSICPTWYNPTIRGKGRKYEIPPDPNIPGHNWGSVIINDETNTVYINVIWS